MLSLKTADDRKRELNLRKNLQLQHEKDVSRLVNLQDSDGQTGCGFCRIFGQRTTKSSNSSSGQQSSSRIFGVSKVCTVRSNPTKLHISQHFTDAETELLELENAMHSA